MRVIKSCLTVCIFFCILILLLFSKSRLQSRKRELLLDYASSCFGVFPSGSADFSLKCRTTPITVIVAAVSSDNTRRMQQESGIRACDSQIVYFADQPSTQNGIPQNKGNEAMVYLTYLIDHYEDLPELMVFMHGHRTGWHNNALLRRSSALMVNKLNPQAVLEHGFVNLACDKVLRRSIKPMPKAPGPSVLDLTREDWETEDGSMKLHSQTDEQLYTQYTSLWHEIFPSYSHTTPPLQWDYFTGAQFALSREHVGKIPLDRLRFLRNWILQTNLSSRSAGAVFETIWEAVFSDGAFKATVPFNTPTECYCNLYGLCSIDERMPVERVETLIEAATLMAGHILDSENR